ncbi:MAG: M50 family metallopeptidase, partial [Candidatus Kapaibacteriota bacterium]
MKIKTPMIISISLFALNFIVFQIQPLRIVLYPFIILSTWFHEMGHGICSLILGGEFLYLQIFADGSGIAYVSSTNSLGNVGSALVALSGPLFPPILGYVFIVSSKNLNFNRLILFLLSVAIFISNLIWVRSTFGFIFLMIMSIIIFLISLSNNKSLQFYISQVVSIQSFMSVYFSIGYLFSSYGDINQSSLYSDTENVAR